MFFFYWALFIGEIYKNIRQGKANLLGGVFYVLSIWLNLIGYYICVLLKLPIDVFAYANPIVILGSVGLFLVFSNLKIKTNKFINWVSNSAFAVYLFHAYPYVYEYIFKNIVEYFYKNTFGFICIIQIFGFLLLLFACSIILDQPRKWIWKKISNIIFIQKSKLLSSR